MRGLVEMKEEQFLKHIAPLYPLLTDLILVVSRDLRLALKDLFLRVGRALKLDPSSAAQGQ
jgi:hypothetical protein